MQKLSLVSFYNTLLRSRTATVDSLRNWISMVSSNLKEIEGEWNSWIHPLISSLPQTKDGVNPFSNGLNGDNLYASLKNSEMFKNLPADRQKTISEALEYLYSKYLELGTYRANLSTIYALLPTLGQKQALVGSNGTPTTANPYVTNSDPRLPTLAEKTAIKVPAWDDLKIPVGIMQKRGAVDPSYVIYKDSFLPIFAQGDELSFVQQMPHDYQEDSDLYLHLHWNPAAQGTAMDGSAVGWAADIEFINPWTVHPDGTTYSLLSTCSGTDDLHQMSPSVLINGSGLNISCIISGRVYRTSVDDTYTNSPGDRPLLYEVDFHYQKDGFGSTSPISK